MRAPRPENSSAESLRPFFQPASVAVVGASRDPDAVGHAVLENLLFGQKGSRDREAGFPGPVYAVNRSGGEVLGVPAYESLAAIGAPVELIVVAIPPRFIAGLMDEAAACGVKAAIVISAGFGELGTEGQALQDAMRDRARAHGIRVVGPNCLGVMRPDQKLNASFGAGAPEPGAIGLLSQSGALVTGVVSYAERERFGLSTAVSLGAKADVDDEDVLEYLAHDDATKALAIYVEAFKEPRRFVKLAAAISAKKPLVAIKGGTSAAGAAAASSHTGSLAGSHAAYDAALAQAGVLQARTVGEFLAWSRALSAQPPAHGKHLCIVTNAGGPGVIAADVADRYGLELARLAPSTLEKLDAVLPNVWSRNNPVDVIGDATPERYRDALAILGEADEVDGLVVIMTVQAMTDPATTAEAIAQAVAELRVPVTASFIGLIGTDVGHYLDERGIPEFNLPEHAVSAMAALMRRGEQLRREEAPEPATDFGMPTPDLAKAAALVAEGRAAGQRIFDLDRARAVLESAGLRYNQSGTADDAEQAVSVAEALGYPVVVKLISPDVVHKSDVGGVVLDVVDADGVREACASIRARVEAAQPGARITGFTIEEQVKGTEVIVGVSRDPDFGPLMMVGLGGVFVEVYKDVAFRLVPMTRRDALDAIGEVKAQALFDGARKRPVLNREELAEAMLRLGALVEAVPAIEELDVNPFVITEKGLIAIDARVIVG
ncbi:MAG: acetate--CoA ligase family protein [Myxococcota bacterium]